jgi:hypothetical protein
VKVPIWSQPIRRRPACRYPYGIAAEELEKGVDVLALLGALEAGNGVQDRGEVAGLLTAGVFELRGRSLMSYSSRVTG